MFLSAQLLPTHWNIKNEKHSDVAKSQNLDSAQEIWLRTKNAAVHLYFYILYAKLK